MLGLELFCELVVVFVCLIFACELLVAWYKREPVTSLRVRLVVDEFLLSLDFGGGLWRSERSPAAHSLVAGSRRCCDFCGELLLDEFAVSVSGFVTIPAGAALSTNSVEVGDVAVGEMTVACGGEGAMGLLCVGGSHRDRTFAS